MSSNPAAWDEPRGATEHTRTRWPGAALKSSLRRLAYLWSLSWLTLELVAEAFEHASAGSLVTPTTTALLASVVTCAAAAAIGPQADKLTLLTLVTVTAVLAWRVDIPSTGQAPQIVYWLPNLVVVAVGLLMPARVAIPATISVATGAGAAIALRLTNAEFPHAIVDATGTFLYALIDGIAAVVVVSAVRGAADLADQSIASADRGRESIQLLAFIMAETKEVGRVVHDTAMNTLSGISTSRLGTDVERIREQCARDANMLRQMLERGVIALRQSPPRWLEITKTVDPLRVRLEGESARSFDEVIAGMPSDVSHAMVGAISEALRNVRKHTSVNEAVVTAIRIDGRFSVVISDHGPGFETRGLTSVERGIATSIGERCREAGVDWSIESEIGVGTSVHLLYIEQRPDDADPSDSDSQSILGTIFGAFIWLFSACLAVLCMVFTAMTWSESSLTTSVPALAVLVAAIMFARVRSHGRLDGFVTGALLAAIPFVTFLPGASLDSCDRTAMPWWGPDAAVVLLTILVFLSHSRWPIAMGLLLYGVAIIAVAGQVGWRNECAPGAILSGLLDASVVAGMWYFRATLTRLARRISVEHRLAARQRGKAAAQQSHLRVMTTRRNAALESSIALLDGMSRGELNPLDDTVRGYCAREEAYLREVTVLESEQTRIGESLARALTVAHEHGIRLTLRTDARDVPSAEAATEASDLIKSVLDTLVENDEATISLLPGQKAATILTIVSTRSGSGEQEVHQLEWRSPSD